MHKTIRKVTDDIEGMKFNTAIAALMSLLNIFTDSGYATRDEYRNFLIMLNPFAPHITEELYEICGFDGVLNEQEWVRYDEALCVSDEIEIVVQINGKLKEKLLISTDAGEDEVIAMALQSEKVKVSIADGTVVKKIYVKGKLVNLVVKP
jgi:leucyl-tRNA synthetase